MSQRMAHLNGGLFDVCPVATTGLDVLRYARYHTSSGSALRPAEGIGKTAGQRRKMANAVLVVDMVVGFLEEGHNLYFEGYREIVPNIRRLIEAEQAAGSEVFFLCDTHVPNDLEFKMFPVHCVEGTEEPELIDEMSGYEGQVVRKRRYSAFHDTDLGQRLAELDPDKLIICGVCTDICVMHTAADARNRDYVVEVPVDCVATFDSVEHVNALRHMEKILGVRLTGQPASVGA